MYMRSIYGIDKNGMLFAPRKLIIQSEGRCYVTSVERDSKSGKLSGGWVKDCAGIGHSNSQRKSGKINKETTFMIDLLIRNVRDRADTSPFDMAIHDGIIIDTGECLDYSSPHVIEGNGRLVYPAFVESHVHLDIALMNDALVPGRPEPYLSHYGLNESLERRRRSFSHEDIVTRSTAALKLAASHGVTAVRAQCHIDREVGFKHLKALVHTREICSPFISLQIVAFPQQGLTNHPDNFSLFQEALKQGIDVMGAAPNLDRNAKGETDYKAHIDMALGLAMEAGVDLDVHADLGLASSIELEELEVVYLAKKTIERGYQGRVTAGHLSTLGSAEPDVAQEAIGLIRESGMNVVCQPDLYRLGREDSKNVRRGLTRVKELLKNGVNVAYASNNVRDALRPMGNFNLLEEGLILAYGAHMDTINELETIMKMGTYNSACILGLEKYGIEAGCYADLNIFDCTSASEAIVGQAEKLYVIRRGEVLVENQPKELTRIIHAFVR